ncbi:BAH_G0000200.mRNA.1.CDS.1 [Saccharomyces cerevisiae]|nr:SX2_G0048790.mRNA.1.CDS.1 [Saccharomyces cerevisiae]CAI4234796.1 BAG_1a_G0000190.mRNA.1.CDS.1 [Saccharomyces cerevisiae]CAI4234867.1 BAH_G0000200.mRNA.1.CDS.1 [Saccharomyces cerevisiae]CAI7033578.1 BAG_1a_G0000190.mRNA.1.CDS.1 [Saccharomyces cerevisiae]CAI7033590.1 BAH_G0000200.mRNA.1.CDS.1 [Saccharomyces cerevisiae]
MTKETIRVVICGDEGVGKSSLIVSLTKAEFIPTIQDVLPPISIPRDFSSSPTYSPKNTVLIDTSDSDLIALDHELKSADVIWLVYCDHESYDHVSLFWLPHFRSLGLNIPVILCKNKCDSISNVNANAMVVSENSDDDIDTKVEDEEFIPILMEFKEIDTCIKTSAKTQFDLNQAFYLCQRAITHPISPLFDAMVGELKPLAVMALKRIFLLSDLNQDSYLDDNEILGLQKKCFNKSIDVNELNFIKDLLLDISKHDQEYINRKLYVPGKGITKDGFLVLNKIYAERGRHETTWAILRTFHYTDSLCINDKILHPKLVVPDTSSVELSPKGYRFLVDIFLKFDIDNDGGLNNQELHRLFKCTPGLPKLWTSTNFPFSTVVNNKGCITLQGWLAQWSMTTFLNYSTTTAYLVYFGFQEDARLALQVTKPRKMRRRSGKLYRSNINDRKVFNCFVIGKPCCGKSSLLEAFLGRSFSEEYSPTIKPRIAVNSLELKGGKQYYLILQELGEQEYAILENKDKLKECDVICLTYDSSDPESFSYLVSLLDKFTHLQDLPLVFVASKADLDKQQQRCQIQPDELADELFVNHPLHISSRWLSSLNELFIKITEAALDPGKNTPGLPEETAAKDVDYRQTALIFGSTVGFVALCSFTLVKLFKSSKFSK